MNDGFDRRENTQPGGTPENATDVSQRRRQIASEIDRLRRQAKVARLEAAAAKMDATADELSEELSRLDEHIRIDHGEQPGVQLPYSSLGNQAIPTRQVSLGGSEASFQSWDDVRRALNKSAPQDLVCRENIGGEHVGDQHDSAAESASVIFPKELSTEIIQRTDAPHRVGPARPNMFRTLSPVDPASGVSNGEASDETSQTPEPKGPEPKGPEPKGPEPKKIESKEIESDETTLAITADHDTPQEKSIEREPQACSEVPGTVVVDEDEESPPARRHPAALVLSAILHLLIVVLLAGFSLTTAIPKDQVALSASTSESETGEMETFQIETVQPAAEPTETDPTETQYDVSPLGEMVAVDVASDVVSNVNQQMAAASSLSESFNKESPSLKALSSDSNAKMEFCGVEGGGNHFVYLVDSSGSMGDAFISARRALLDSIDMLSEKQRFYVIFFDAECDYMRIARADQDESRSVYATRENKSKLRAWAMRIAMDRGKAPYEPLEFALTKLKPDVIFLLSDGEFPSKIETIIMDNNRVSNLFGEENPVSIIHTISYHSREGEDRMRRIAENHSGQYRHVPKP